MPIAVPPGLHIDDIGDVPNGVVPVATAIPAFIGYTPRAECGGVSYLNRPTRIGSFAEFAAIFLLPTPPAPASPSQQYRPQYFLVPQTAAPQVGRSLDIRGRTYAVLPDPGTVYHLYNSVRLFYMNGGGDAWIVSVGPYGPASGEPIADAAAPIVNPNVEVSELLAGLAQLRQEPEPTLYVCPEATLLSPEDNATLMRTMLAQAQTMGTALCLFDVVNGDRPAPSNFMNDIRAFRDATGDVGLDRGACYYPFVDTTVMQDDELDFTNLFGGDTTRLTPLLDPPDAPNPVVAGILDSILHPPADPRSNAQLESALRNASAIYDQLMRQVLAAANTLPATGAIAGLYAANDAAQGVWHAPADVGVVGAWDLPIRLTDDQQSQLNLDPTTGKSINAIRVFQGRGILVWGARTLDGNSDDWRYIPVRRTVIYIEQSIRQALQRFAFEPNDANTWSAVQSMVVAFLTDVWRQGGLQGASASDAFSVSVGLGTGMTSQDILDGRLRLQIELAVAHPAEFVALMIEQPLSPPT